MSSRHPTRRRTPRGGYHHGDLRHALVAAAIEILETVGDAGLGLRAAAARAGVSPAAPYRHFANRQALITAVATRGFEDLAAALAAAVQPSAAPLDRLLAMARAYLAFAAHRPVMYRLMFTENHFSGARDALDRTAGACLAAVAAAMADGSEDGARLATALWAAIHGTAMLRFARLVPVEGPKEGAAAAASVDALAALIVRRLMAPSD